MDSFVYRQHAAASLGSDTSKLPVEAPPVRTSITSLPLEIIRKIVTLVAEDDVHSLYPLSLTAKALHEPTTDALFCFAGNFSVFDLYDSTRGCLFREGWTGLRRIQENVSFRSLDDLIKWFHWSSLVPGGSNVFQHPSEFSVGDLKERSLEYVLNLVFDIAPQLSALSLGNNDIKLRNEGTPTIGPKLASLFTLSLENFEPLVGTPFFPTLALRMPNIHTLSIEISDTRWLVSEYVEGLEQLSNLRDLSLRTMVFRTVPSGLIDSFRRLEKLTINFHLDFDDTITVRPAATPGLFCFSHPRLRELVFMYPGSYGYLDAFTAGLAQGCFPKLERFTTWRGRGVRQTLLLLKQLGS